jgi:hypothetical protein
VSEGATTKGEISLGRRQMSDIRMRSKYSKQESPPRESDATVAYRRTPQESNVYYEYESGRAADPGWHATRAPRINPVTMRDLRIRDTTPSRILLIRPDRAREHLVHVHRQPPTLVPTPVPTPVLISHGTLPAPTNATTITILRGVDKIQGHHCVVIPA